MQKQLENTPSIKALQIAEKLERLKQFNNNNNNKKKKKKNDDDNDDARCVSFPQLLSPPFPPLAYPSSIDRDESNI